MIYPDQRPWPISFCQYSIGSATKQDASHYNSHASIKSIEINFGLYFRLGKRCKITTDLDLKEPEMI